MLAVLGLDLARACHEDGADVLVGHTAAAPSASFPPIPHSLLAPHLLLAARDRQPLEIPVQLVFILYCTLCLISTPFSVG